MTADDTPNTLTSQQLGRLEAAAAYAGTTEDNAAYQAFVDPAGDHSTQVQVAHAVSACMLLAASLLGWRGKFVGNTIQVILAELWTSVGGGRVPDVDNGIAEGAQVWWAANGAAEEHVDACVERVERVSLYHLSLVVIAAGQRVTAADVAAGAFGARELGKRCCKRLTREVSWSGSSWVDDANGRHVRLVLDA